MVFSSPWFLAFLAVTLAVLSLPWANDTKKRLLSVASCFFYAAWDYRYLGLLLAVSTIDWVCAGRIHRASAAGPRRRWLLLSMITNLGLLAYFKYCNFFLENLNGVLGATGVRLPHLDILLPAGISFYTFKTMSYVIDVYRRELKPTHSLLDYVMFVTFFPELIAGPIVRASVFLPQMSTSIGPTRERLALGGSAFLLGMTKKMLADRLGMLAAPVFADPRHYGAVTLWAAAVEFSLQIYCDFSGYSDMAIGTARMMGYRLPENFDMPYLSASITEFWRRWHITLSSWLRDYLYIPLGGNRKGPGRTYANLMLTMLLGGLWHGASWNFVVWGGLHGAALALHRRIGARGQRPPWPTWFAAPLTMLFVILCWVPFRCSGWGATWSMWTGMFGLGAGVLRRLPPDLGPILAVIAAGHGMGVLIRRARKAPAEIERSVPGWTLGALSAQLESDAVSGPYVRLGARSVAGSTVIVLWALLVFLLFSSVSTPFLYFQF
jgi:alginate O-acetyltransferase complex protein AlgI